MIDLDGKPVCYFLWVDAHCLTGKTFSVLLKKTLWPQTYLLLRLPLYKHSHFLWIHFPMGLCQKQREAASWHQFFPTSYAKCNLIPRIRSYRNDWKSRRSVLYDETPEITPRICPLALKLISWHWQRQRLDINVFTTLLVSRWQQTATIRWPSTNSAF